MIGKCVPRLPGLQDFHFRSLAAAEQNRRDAAHVKLRLGRIE
jgi:hypothetical protein